MNRRNKEQGFWGRIRSFILHTSSFILISLQAPLLASGQNMPHEAGFLFAVNGQALLVNADNVNRGFFTNPTIEHFYYSFLTSGIQSLSIFLEHVDETRGWSGTWTDAMLNGGSINFPAHVNERLEMTIIGLETTRTLLSAADFRLGAGLGLGVGLGGASAEVTNDSTLQGESHASGTAWLALSVNASLRARYTVYTSGKYDFSIIALGRVWVLPYIGPSGSAGTDYNGPDLRALSEYGYLAGVSVGF